MLRLQENDEVIYNNSENIGLVEDLNFVSNGFQIILPDKSIVFVPENGCTASERDVFNAYHEFYRDSNGIKPLDPPSLDNVKANKIMELNRACTNAILFGFEYTRDDVTYLLGFDEQDQSNLTQQMAIISITPEPIVWKVKGELIFVTFTREEFLEMGMIAKQHKEGKMQRYYQLCIQVNMCTTMEEINAIVW